MMKETCTLGVAPYNTRRYLNIMKFEQEVYDRIDQLRQDVIDNYKLDIQDGMIVDLEGGWIIDRKLGTVTKIEIKQPITRKPP